MVGQVLLRQRSERVSMWKKYTQMATRAGIGNRHEVDSDRWDSSFIGEHHWDPFVHALGQA